MSSLPTRGRRWAAIVLGAAAAAAVVAGAAGGGEATTARAAANVTITAHDFFWTPQTVQIEPGDTVTWTNAQGFHNVLLGDEQLNAPGFPNEPPWNPPPQRTFNEPGSYTFICEVHPAMTGTVNVGSDPQPTPTPTPPSPVPPPGGAPPDTTAPAITNLTVTGLRGRVSVRLTLSEPATVNARFAGADEVTSLRAQVKQGTTTIERVLPGGRYDYELWAVDAMSNRSSTHPGQVRVRG